MYCFCNKMKKSLTQMSLFRICFISSCLCFIGMPQQSNGEILHVELISLGTVSPSTTVSLVYIAPAMETTVEELRRGDDSQHLQMSLSFLYNRVAAEGADVAFYSDQMIANWYYQDRSKIANLSVIISPGGSEDIYLNRLAANWNVLLITCGSTKEIQRNKQLSPTWVSTSAYSVTDAARLYARIVSRYNWTSLFVVHDRTSSPVFNTASNVVPDQLRASSHNHITTASINGKSIEECKNALRLFTTISRVLLFFGHAEPFRWFMIQAFQLNMTNKDYVRKRICKCCSAADILPFQVYIILEPFHHNVFGNYTWQNEDSNDTVASVAFKSVLFLAPEASKIGTSNHEFTTLSNEWRRRSKEEYNYTYAPEEMFVPHVAGARYTIHMLAEVLNETLSMTNFDYRDGKVLAKMMSNRTFVVDDTEIFMDKYGQRQLNWSLSYFDDKLGSFQPFLTQNGKLQKLEETAALQWYDGNVLPANEPFCGYRGIRPVCLQSVSFSNTYGFVVCGLVIGFTVALAIGMLLWREFSNPSNTFWWILREKDIRLFEAVGKEDYMK